MATRTKKPADSREVENFPIDQITADKEELQPRATLNNEAISDYQDAYFEGVDMPPLEIVSDGETNWLVDGFHRLAALKKLDFLEAPKVIIRPGSKSDAIRAAIAANRNFGVRRTNADKTRAVQMAFRLMASEGKNWTDTVIAEMAGVSSMFVGKLREPEPEGTPKVRTTASGAVIKVGNQGRKPAAPTLKTPEPKANKAGPVGIALDKLIHDVDRLGQDAEFLHSIFPNAFNLGESLTSNAATAVTFGKIRKRLETILNGLNAVPLGIEVTEDSANAAQPSDTPKAAD